MKQILKTITICSFAAIISIFTFSCRKLVGDLEPYDPVPVVNSLLISGDQINVHVSFATLKDDRILPICENAIVNLFVDDVFAETLEYSGSGLYISDIIAEVGTKYSCEVIIPEFDTLRAQTTIPEPSNVYNLEYVEIAGYDEESRAYPSIKFTFDTDPNERLYYHAVIKLYEGDYHWDPINEEFYFVPGSREVPLYYTSDPVILNEGTDYPVFSNEIIENNSYRMDLSFFTGSSHSNSYPVILELNAASEDYYKYIKQVYLARDYENNMDYPMTGALPVHNLHSNVTGGFGIFAGVSVTDCDTIYPPNYYHGY